MAEGPAPANPADTQGTRPVPDPTVLTTEQLLRAVAAEREYVDSQLAIRDERLRGIDEATQLRVGGVADLSEALEDKIKYERELNTEKFTSVAQQFVERDTRSEREARDNKVAVDAAFAAQKEAAQKQDEANQKAIDKSETAMDEKVNKLEQLFKTTTDALADKVDDVKQRQNETNLTVGGLIQNGAGQQMQKVEQRAVTAGQLAFGGLIVTVVSLIIGYLIANPPG